MLQIFKNESFGEIRTVTIDGEPWFVGKDVAEALGFTNSRDAIRTHVFPEDRGVEPIDTLGGKQKLTVINEVGVYALVFGSRLKSALEFKHWIAKEVLPSIRKTGRYSVTKTPELTDKEILSRAVLVADRTIKTLENKSRALEAKIETDRPKVEFAEALLTSDACMTVGDFAKKAHESGIDITERKLFRWMLENQYLMRRYGRGRGAKGYVPTAKSERMKLFEIDLKTYYAHGKERSSATSLITPKGQEYFIRKLKEQNGKDDRNGILFN